MRNLLLYSACRHLIAWQSVISLQVSSEFCVTPSSVKLIDSTKLCVLGICLTAGKRGLITKGSHNAPGSRETNSNLPYFDTGSVLTQLPSAISSVTTFISALTEQGTPPTAPFDVEASNARSVTIECVGTLSRGVRR